MAVNYNDSGPSCRERSEAREGERAGVRGWRALDELETTGIDRFRDTVVFPAPLPAGSSNFRPEVSSNSTLASVKVMFDRCYSIECGRRLSCIGDGV